MQQKAARQGIGEAVRFFDMTPMEVSLCLSAHVGRENRMLEKIHLQAALSALSFHAPSRLPSFSSPLPEENMTADEMKQRLLSWRRKDEP